MMETIKQITDLIWDIRINGDGRLSVTHDDAVLALLNTISAWDGNVYVVVPPENGDAAVFWNEDDAVEFGKTYAGTLGDESCYPEAERCFVADSELTKQMISERIDEPEYDGLSCERCGVEPAATCECPEES